jgi:hypothetical protein
MTITDVLTIGTTSVETIGMRKWNVYATRTVTTQPAPFHGVALLLHPVDGLAHVVVTVSALAVIPGETLVT